MPPIRDKLVSFGLLYAFYAIWMVSMALAVISVPIIIFSSTYRVYIITFYALYFSYRAIHPLGPWSSLSTWVVDAYKKYPYFTKEKLVFDDTQPPKARSNTLMAFHPHGILGCGWLVNGGANEAFQKSNFSWLVTDLLFLVPFMSNLLAWFGGGGAGRTNFENLAKNGENIALLPGGFEEATIYTYKHHRVYIKNRKGFIKLALKYGYKVHPVYSFGEEETFRSFPYFLKQRVWLNRFKIPGVIFHGLWYCAFMPFSNIHITTVVGKPIQLPKIDHPTVDDVKKYHDQYVDALQTVFEKYKGQYATDPTAILEID
ncbi:diacylglycerol O-acyltransferase [Thraustotheca clavata]|uniref:Acyltransferase n=1 Tax=Thraustotheca clavata TaxID=74557 RepID=A0A1V9ZWD1_9STRA|nr:diacylglycerol O-acyltransferase [Thraustotheca clavata]